MYFTINYNTGEIMDNQPESFKNKIVKQYKDFNLYVSEFGETYRQDGKERKQHIHRSGYLRTCIMINRISYAFQIHRIVAELFLPPPPQWMVDKCANEHWGKVLVLHKDNNKFNNHYINLKWGTLEDNTSQAFKDGLVQNSPGEKNGQAKLSDSLVHSICEFYQNGGSRKEAENSFDISRHQAYSIYTKRKWLHVSCQYDF